MRYIFGFVFFVFLFGVLCVPARADLCRVYGAGFGEMAVRDCDTPPTGWVECDSFMGERTWCSPNVGQQSATKKHNNNTVILVSAGVTLAVVAVAWYFFKKAPSKNNPGQVQLATF